MDFLDNLMSFFRKKDVPLSGHLFETLKARQWSDHQSLLAKLTVLTNQFNDFKMSSLEKISDLEKELKTLKKKPKAKKVTK